MEPIIHDLEKMRFTALGVYPEEFNEISIVGNFFGDESTRSAPMDIFSKGSVPVLLPYCAKMITCKFRYMEGCERCGRCDIGKVYMLAEEYGMEPITIQNYEMLEGKLESLKKRGCQAFIGICCEAFLSKHRRDFERIGLPGILINVDNSACYDLGKEQEAHEGKFENQTQLKYELIRRVLSHIGESSKTHELVIKL